MDFIKQFRFFPEEASSVAGRVDTLAIWLFLVSAFFTLLICVLIVWFALRYRRRTEDEIPPETVSHHGMEWSWSAAIFVLLMVFFVWGAKLYVVVKKPPTHAMEIYVVAKQWMWKIQHPEGQREIDELHVPVGRTVKLIMTSEDVIHDFGLPDFRIKQDVLPGSYSTEWFTATKPGEYHLFCQEYCGTLHSEMIGRVVVMLPHDYEAWLAGTVPDVSPVQAGAKLFATYGCAQCHGQLAPTLAGLYGRNVQLDNGRTVVADESYIRESILNPPAKIVANYPARMPSFRGQLSEEQLIDLVEYIKSLGAAAPTTAPINGVSPDAIFNQPPARQPPPVAPIPRGVNQ
jgi:cytochrome c oxidase subunit 2